MKKIVIITDRARIADNISKDLIYVFRDRVNIEKLTLEAAGRKEEIDGDVLLFTLGNRIEYVKDKIIHPENILVMRRTLREKNFLKIFEIPKNTKVLVVNDNYENTLQTVALLYDLNVDNIVLSPYNEDDYDHSITLAITPGEPEIVPKHIKKVIDIGDRCLDLSTFMEIIYRLQINDDDISRRLLSYVNQIVNSDEGINKHYKDALIKNIQMERVLEMSELGIMMTLPDGEITLCNKKFLQLTAVEVKEGKTKIQDIFDETALNILCQEELCDIVLKINGRDIVISKNRISYEKGIYQELYFFKDVTYIRSLEQTVTGQIKSRGFVARYHIEDIIYHSRAMEKCIESAKVFAGTGKTILILGESGTGKELFAQSIHNLSERRLQPFVAVNCAAVPANLLESELFGYVKGAFTGASKEGKAGLFEYANNGTIFLDEIGDMPYELQSRLLRVIQEKQIMRIGSDKLVDINVRIISATNKNLHREMEAGRFRSDLYYRIGVLPITIPALRERREDIMSIFKSFLNKNAVITPDVEQLLVSYDWPGNVRELGNVAEYFELMSGHENCIPEYLSERTADNVRYTQLGNKRLSLEDEILRIILDKSMDGENIGRERLKEILGKNFGLMVSEYRLRNVISELETGGFIMKTIGRKGTILTERGKERLGL